MSLTKLVKENKERNAIYNTFRNILNCKAYDIRLQQSKSSEGIEIIDDDLIRYLLKKSEIEVKLTASIKELYRKKIFEALQHELEVIKATYYNQMTSEKLGIQQQPVSTHSDQNISSDVTQTDNSTSENDISNINTPQPNNSPYTELEQKINSIIYTILIKSKSDILLNNKDLWAENNQLKYFNAPQFIKFVISKRTQEDLNKLSRFSEKGQTFAISYGNRSYNSDPDGLDTAQYNISKGAIGFNTLNEEGKDCSDFYKNAFSLLPYAIVEKGGIGGGTGTDFGVYINSENDFEIMKDVIISCYEMRIKGVLQSIVKQ